MKHFFKAVSSKLSNSGLTKTQLFTVVLCYFLSFMLFLGVVVIWDPMSKPLNDSSIVADDTTPTGPTNIDGWWIGEGNYSIDWYLNAQEIEIDGVTYEPGDKENPYKISTAADLAGLSYLTYFGSASNSLNPSDIDKEVINGIECNVLFKGVYFEQSASFDLSSFIWQPIGIEYDRAGNKIRNLFSGNYDGKNFTIDSVNTPAGSTNAYSYQGLFGGIMNSIIRDVNVSNSQVEGYEYVGGIVGGVANKSKIINCTFDGEVKGKTAIGGIAGAITNAQILDCKNYGKISSAFVENCGAIGGIVGQLNYDKGASIFASSEFFTSAMRTTVEKSNNFGQVNGAGATGIGGVIGNVKCLIENNDMLTQNIENSPLVFDCSNSGEILGYSSVGGIIGFFESTSYGFSNINEYCTWSILRIDRCFNNGEIMVRKENINSENYFVSGGILGYANIEFGTISISNSYNLGAVLGYFGTGGIIGGITTASSARRNAMTNCYNGGKITGEISLGGLIGFSMGTESIKETDGTTHTYFYVTCTATNSYNLGIIYNAKTQSEVDNGSAISLYGETPFYYPDPPDQLEMLNNCHTAYSMNSKNFEWVKENLKWDFGFIWDSQDYGAVDGVTNQLAFLFKNEDDYDWWISENLVDIDFEGNGTKDDPYLISSAEELAGLSYLVYNYPYVDSNIYDDNNITDALGSDLVFTNIYFKQTADIDMSGHMWQPIGVEVDRQLNMRGRYFSGHYDGAGFSISNLTTQYGAGLNYEGQGLFGTTYPADFDSISKLPTTNVVSITNVHLKNCDINGSTRVGGIAASGFVGNCSNEGGTVNGNSGVGGLVGIGFVEKSYSSSTVSGINSTDGTPSSVIGGLVGQGTAINSYNVGNVSGGNAVGGIVGAQAEGYEIKGKILSFKNCYNLGQISGNGQYVGGLIGSGTNISNSFNLGEVSNLDSTEGYTGGLVGGSNNKITITRGFYGGDCADFGDGNYFATLSEDIKDENFLINEFNWDMFFTWKNSEDPDFPYPVLRENGDIDWWIGEDNTTGLANYDISWFTNAGDGVGDSEQNPYILQDAEDLAGLSYLVYHGQYINKNGETVQLPFVEDLLFEKYQGIYFADKYFKLVNDIDLSGKLWQPIGTYFNKLTGEEIGHAFGGNFDGGGHVISGIITATLTGVNDAMSGLFGFVSGGINQTGVGDIIFMPTIKNIKIENSNIQGYASVGSVVGLSVLSNIVNCSSSAVVGVNGGILKIGNGFGEDEIMTILYTAGGIVGFSSFSNIRNCIFTGEVVGDLSYFDKLDDSGGIGYGLLGGIVGQSYSDSKYSILISSQNEFGTISFCYNYGYIGNINNLSYFMPISGGIVARTSGTKYYNCCNYGLIQGVHASGGIAGMLGAYTIYSDINENGFSWNYASILANEFYGCINYGKIIGGLAVGGIAGSSTDAIIGVGAQMCFVDCANFGTITNIYLEDANEWIVGIGVYSIGIGGICGALGFVTEKDSVVNCVVDCDIVVNPEMGVEGVGAIYGDFLGAFDIIENEGTSQASFNVIKNCTIKVNLYGYNVESFSDLIIGQNKSVMAIEDLADNVIIKYGQKVFKINGNEYISNKIDDTLRLTDSQGKTFTDNTINVNGEILSYICSGTMIRYLFFDKNGDLFFSNQKVTINGAEFYIHYDFTVGQAKFVPVNGGDSIYASGNELTYNGETYVFTGLDKPEPEGVFISLNSSNPNVKINYVEKITINGVIYDINWNGTNKISLTDTTTQTTYQYFNGKFYINGEYYSHSYEGDELILIKDGTDEILHQELGYKTGVCGLSTDSLENNFVFVDAVMEGIPVPIKSDGTYFFHLHTFGSTENIYAQLEKLKIVPYNLIEEPFVTESIYLDPNSSPDSPSIIVPEVETLPYELDLTIGKEYVITLYVEGQKIVHKTTAVAQPNGEAGLVFGVESPNIIILPSSGYMLMGYVLPGGKKDIMTGDFIELPGETWITFAVQELDAEGVPTISKQVELVSIREFIPTNLLDEPIVLQTRDTVMDTNDFQTILDRNFNLQLGATYKVSFNVIDETTGEVIEGSYTTQATEGQGTGSDDSTFSSIVLTRESDLVVGEYMVVIVVIDNAKIVVDENGENEYTILSPGESAIHSYLYEVDETTGEPVAFLQRTIEITGITLIA